MAATKISSAAGLLSLLEEPSPELKAHALRSLTQVVDQFWSQVAQSLEPIQALAENESFMAHNDAALLASKLHYHLESFDDSVYFALRSGVRFDEEKSEFADKLIERCVDMYKEQRQKMRDIQMEGGETEGIMDPLLEIVIERIFERVCRDGAYKQGIGLAIDTYRLDQIEQIVRRVAQDPLVDVALLLNYCFELAQLLDVSKSYREELLRCLVSLYENSALASYSRIDHIAVARCLVLLLDAEAIATLLAKLALPKEQKNIVDAANNEYDVLIAFQIAFDVHESQNWPFLLEVKRLFAQKAEAASGSADNDAENNAMTDEVKTEEETLKTPVQLLQGILSGDTPQDLDVRFLYNRSASDKNVIKLIKDKIDKRSSIQHNATVMAHAYMYAGTCRDTWLRDNPKWFRQAKNWGKFTATASYGVIHRGNVRDSTKLLGAFLPQQNVNASPYQEGGALFALGLIHASQSGCEKVDFMMDALRKSSHNEIVQHGACLGLGLVAMATGRRDAVEQLTDILRHVDSSVAGEAAGLAIGLVCLGRGAEVEDIISRMLSDAAEQERDKVVRGLAMGVALAVYGQQEHADVLIEQMLSSTDSRLRYGGCFAMAMAYACTSSNDVVQKLLGIAVSDLNNDVRRGAVVSLGFVLGDQPEQVPVVVKLLAESFNPYVRYGTAMALGIACAGTGSMAALKLLEPLRKDREDYVKQGAFIATAMVLLQHNDAAPLDKEGKPIRQNFHDECVKFAGDQRADNMTRFGAVLSLGILNAGGRNCSISMMAPGSRRMAAIAGLALFAQYWYWYPLLPFLSLAFTPTAVIGLNKDLDIVTDFSVRSCAPPSRFAYPPEIEVKKAEKKKKMAKATLSTTKKAAMRRQRKKRGGKGDNAMTDDGDEEAQSTESHSSQSESGKKDSSSKDTSDKLQQQDKSENEPDFELVPNFSRITVQQREFVTVDADQRYQPVKQSACSGFLVLHDTRPHEPQKLLEEQAVLVGSIDDEPAPPEPFEFTRY